MPPASTQSRCLGAATSIWPSNTAFASQIAAISPAMLFSAPLNLQESIVTTNASSRARTVDAICCESIACRHDRDSTVGPSTGFPIRLLSILLVGAGLHSTTQSLPVCCPLRGLNLALRDDGVVRLDALSVSTFGRIRRAEPVALRAEPRRSQTFRRVYQSGRRKPKGAGASAQWPLISRSGDEADGSRLRSVDHTSCCSQSRNRAS